MLLIALCAMNWRCSERRANYETVCDHAHLSSTVYVHIVSMFEPYSAHVVSMFELYMQCAHCVDV
jgi:hypothetical protein